ncbi:oxalurate catabolism protein HpxZ [Aquabacterium sp.]|uniref:oxalurate catabolism protein HpxZ n=1 Tax=Aquabacterium sp. TaxID=1872578 RepID=UPI002C01603B|nr:oxalurate catabolism protein HpxZ [Aquabacterium sp.]HSW08222.1 oxalurate catabolism protein HpxZ [Aquabacterium sp.]
MRARVINDAQVAAELTQAFHDYERALMANDRAALDAYFWNDERVTRYGIADRQWGAEALRAFRAATPAPAFTRTLHELRINSFGDDVATVQVEFVRTDSPLRGFQSQTWVRFDDGWKIVAAHVSMIAFDG